MPRVLVVESLVGEDREVDVPNGGWLVDVADEARLPIPFSCRSANCATCHIDVLEGAELFEPPRAAEAELLEWIDAPRGTRLACQAEVKPGPGLIRLRPR